jgi:YD repeat-containing protein
MSVTIATIDFDRADYDRDADVLYLSIGDPARAVEFDETADGHALRYDADGHLVGVTIVGARQLVEQHSDVRLEAPITVSADALASIVA